VDEKQSADGTVKLSVDNRITQGILILLRVLLGGAFVVAAAGKIADPDSFATSILHYKIITGTPALAIATVLPWMELLVGLGLLTGLFLRGNALLAAVLMGVFTILVASVLVRGLDISCGCFTQDPSAVKIGWWKLLENIGWLAAAIVLIVRRSRWLSAERYIVRASDLSHPDV
jgi:putative oxidoreductase